MADNEMKDEEMGGAESLSDKLGFISKLFAPARLLIRLHLKVAYSEFKKDSERFTAGLFQVFLGLFFLVGFLIMLNVVIATALYQFLFAAKNIFFPVLITTGINLLASLLFFAAAKGSFKEKFFDKTRKLVKETVEELAE